ncbi:DGQHR domain-containing protein [Mammaliicoccus sciuri]|uniref:DGQHR domain-containing protein n=1 Tax=Mammaliicoccus sciuri TaxID=1296 RepID=UPI003CF7E8BF
MYKTPYIEINQNNEIFFMTKMHISFLMKVVNFHFRNPYKEFSKDFLNAENYTNKLKDKLNVKVSNEDEGIQRRTDIKRISEISNYIINSDGIIFPTPIVLAFNVFENENSSKYYNFSENYIEFSDSVEFTIIDGQHRLAGCVEFFNKYDKDIELPITLIPNASLSTATKLFIDINGNQRKVNKSMIYDLYDNIEENDIESIKKYISVVKILNDRVTSPLHNKIKVLGTGTGSISQAFLVDYIQNAYENIDKNKDMQSIYSEMFIYFKVISEIYEKYWCNNSVILKTNGIGALLLLFPKVYSEFKNSNMEYKEFILNYFSYRKNFNWSNEEYSKGTGKKIQKIIAFDLSKKY